MNKVAVVVDSRGYWLVVNSSYRSWIVKNTSVESAVLLIFCMRRSKLMDANIYLHNTFRYLVYHEIRVYILKVFI